MNKRYIQNLFISLITVGTALLLIGSAAYADQHEESVCEQEELADGPCPGYCDPYEYDCEDVAVDGQKCHKCVSQDPCWRHGYFNNPYDCDCSHDNCVKVSVYDHPEAIQGCWECLDDYCPEGYKFGSCPQKCPEKEVCVNHGDEYNDYPCWSCRDKETVEEENKCDRVEAYVGMCHGICDDDEDCEGIFLDDGTNCHRCYEKEDEDDDDDGGGTTNAGGDLDFGDDGMENTVGGGGMGEVIETCSQGGVSLGICERSCDPGTCIQVDTVTVNGNELPCWACQPDENFCEEGYLNDDSCAGTCDTDSRCRETGRITDEDGKKQYCYACKEINCAMYNKFDSCSPNPCTSPDRPICKEFILDSQRQITCAYCVGDVSAGGTAHCVGIGCHDGMEIDCSGKAGSIASFNHVTKKLECKCPPKTIDRGDHCAPIKDIIDEGGTTNAVSIGNALGVFNAQDGTLQGGSSGGAQGMDTSTGSGTATAVGVGGEGLQDYSGFAGQEDDQEQDDQEQDDQESDSPEEVESSSGSSPVTRMLSIPGGGGILTITDSPSEPVPSEPVPEPSSAVDPAGGMIQFNPRTGEIIEQAPGGEIEQQSSGQQEVESLNSGGLFLQAGPSQSVEQQSGSYTYSDAILCSTCGKVHSPSEPHPN